MSSVPNPKKQDAVPAAYPVSEQHKRAFVRAYEKLYDLLKDGTFPPGSQLPPEVKLAAMIGVSRMTLRQALAVLCEDGIITKHQGRGNFVIDRQDKVREGLDVVSMPVFKCCASEIDSIELEFHIELPNKANLELFRRDTLVSIAALLWYRSRERLVAYTVSLIPIETVVQLNVDLNDKENLQRMLLEDVYRVANRVHLQIGTTDSGDFITDKYAAEGMDRMILLREDIYDSGIVPLVCNKHYFPQDECRLELWAKKPT